jgi:DNA polymerase III epsilon subunit-like protein
VGVKVVLIHFNKLLLNSMSSPGNYIFFDTETNALGRMSNPVTQTLMQLAWVVTDQSGSIQGMNTRLVKGALCVGPKSPHGLTPAYVDENGDDAQEVIRDFLEDCETIVEGGGRVVAHNVDFDVGVLEHALGHELPPHIKKGMFCTMKDARVIKHCGTRRYPSLSGVYKTLFGQDPTETLHDALGDTHVLRKNFHKLMDLGVVSFAPPPATTLVDRHQCDLFINASDVSALSGMMEHFDSYPHEVVERVLTRFGSKLGVSGHGTTPASSVAQVKVHDILETARHTTCENSTVLGKRERAMHDSIDERGDISPATAREAKRLVSSRLARTYGTNQEPVVVNKLDLRDTNSDTFHLGCGEVDGVKWGLAGKVDGFSGGRLVEVKNRKKKLFNRVPEYEQVQVQIYMKMVGVHDATLVESFTDARGTAMAEHRVLNDNELWSVILAECGAFVNGLLTLTKSPQLWADWEGGGVEERKVVWGKCKQ